MSCFSFTFTFPLDMNISFRPVKTYSLEKCSQVSPVKNTLADSDNIGMHETECMPGTPVAFQKTHPGNIVVCLFTPIFSSRHVKSNITMNGMIIMFMLYNIVDSEFTLQSIVWYLN
jgi:hypothetical protein